jgi:hypothetical protein
MTTNDSDSGSLVIFASDKSLWFNSGAKGSITQLNICGKGKGVRKTPLKTRCSAKSLPSVVNPCFVDMASAVSDQFWKTTFIDASYNKFHRGFRFDATSLTLTFKIRNKTHSLPLAGLGTTDRITASMNFMRSTAGIMSKTDTINRTRHLNQLLAMKVEPPIDMWGKIKIAQQKQVLICKFVATIAEHYKLSDAEADQLDHTVRFGVAVKYFDSSNIHMQNGVITRIDGLIRDEHGNFDIDLNVVGGLSKKKSAYHYEDDDEGEEIKPTTQRVNFFKKWTKLIDTLAKKGIPKVIKVDIKESCPSSGTIDESYDSNHVLIPNNYT